MRRLIDIYKDAFSNLNREVWLLSLIMLINRAGSMILTFAALYMTRELGMGLSSVGLIMGSYGIGSILGAFIGGELTDRVGYYKVMLYSLMSSALLLLVFIQLEGFYPLLICIFTYAVFTDMVRPANSVAVAENSEESNRARSYSLLRFAANLGFAIGPAVGGIVSGSFGYIWIFLIDAASCFFAAYILFVNFKPSLSKKVKETLQRSVKTLSGRSAYMDAYFLVFIFLVAIYGILFFQLFATVPVFMAKEWMWTEGKIGILLACNGLFIVLFEMPFMRKVEHVKDYGLMITIGAIMLVVSFSALIYIPSMIVAAAFFILLMSISEMFAMPFMTNFCINRPHESRRGQYMALYSMAYGVAHTMGPMGTMYYADIIGFTATYRWMILGSILLSVAFWFWRKAYIQTSR